MFNVGTRAAVLMYLAELLAPVAPGQKVTLLLPSP